MQLLRLPHDAFRLLDLPHDIFQHIIAYTIPAEASDLNPDTYKAYKSTVHLQLVSEVFYREVTRQLFLIRPLQIRVFDQILLQKLTSGRIYNLSSLEEHTRGRINYCQRLSRLSLRMVPLHRFRRLNVHIIPLLAPVNVSSDLEFKYFKASGSDRFDESLTSRYKRILDLQHDVLLEQARGISQALEEIESAHSAIFSRDTRFRILFHDDPENYIPPYLLPNATYSIPRAPVQQLTLLPCSATSAQSSTALYSRFPSLPMWSPSDVLRVIETFSWIGIRNDDRMDLQAYPTFDETIRLPSTLACLHHDTTKTTSWHHNYWRQRFRHCFTHFEDTARNIGMEADSLQDWHAGRTNVRPKGWTSPPNPTVILPRLVLQDLDLDLLENQGCVCIGGFACCVDPARSGCETCPVCNVERGPRGNRGAYEVLLPNASLIDSQLARRLMETNHIVRHALAAQDFDLKGTLKSFAEREFLMEQKALYYVASDWQAEFLTRAIPKSRVGRMKRRLRDWVSCMKECTRAVNERGMWRGLKWVEGESERTSAAASNKPGASNDTNPLRHDLDDDGEIFEPASEQKHVMHSLILGEEEYQEDVAEARIEIRAAVEKFTGARFDEEAVGDRLMREINQQLSISGLGRVRSRDDDSSTVQPRPESDEEDMDAAFLEHIDEVLSWSM